MNGTCESLKKNMPLIKTFTFMYWSCKHYGIKHILITFTQKVVLFYMQSKYKVIILNTRHNDVIPIRKPYDVIVPALLSHRHIDIAANLNYYVSHGAIFHVIWFYGKYNHILSNNSNNNNNISQSVLQNNDHYLKLCTINTLLNTNKLYEIHA